ncbi:MAG TPA: T9SS type A sorting domain-containing protein [Bacteroidia bacterium]|nr:T9SS type A sorting domain-containing protein [Bacteroidia bacterium]
MTRTTQAATVFKGFLLLFTFLLSFFNTQAQLSYTFTNAGATGLSGPTQAQLNTAYLSTSLNGLVSSTAGIQSWTVPPGVSIIQIDAYGAQGGSSNAAGGLGARMKGDFTVTPGQVLKILVGQMGISYLGGAAGGGGASFVSSNSNVPLLVAGGGGGANISLQGYGATTTSVGNPGQSCSNAGATGFGGGSSILCGSGTGGGGGFYGDGISTGSWGYQNGFGFVNGGNGGTSAYGGCHGGFGGGGGTHANNTGGGPGGGYTGGGASYHGSGYVGGAGSSFNAGTNQLNVAAINSGHGRVIITIVNGVQVSVLNPVMCFGMSNGALSATVVGGTAPYTYTWSTGANSNTVSNLAPGVYTCSATDALSTVFTTTYSLSQPPPISASVSTNSLTCNNGSNGSASITVSGGVSPYSYTWSPTGGNAAVASGLNAGTYSCIVKDANLCTAVYSATLSQPPPVNLLAYATNTLVCQGSSITLIGSGASTYTWSGGALNNVAFIPAQTTTYVLNATAAGGCTASAFVSVSVVTAPTVAATGTAITCAGVPVSFTASGANSYTWSNGMTGSVVTFTAAATSNYTVYGSGANACVSSTVIGLQVLNAPTVSAVASATEVCSGSSLTLNGTGTANTFSWTSSSGIPVVNGVPFNPTVSATYSVNGINGAGCISLVPALVYVQVKALPPITISGPGSVCAASAATLSASGAYTYTWMGTAGGSTFLAVPLVPSVFSVSGTGVNNCVNMVTYTLGILPALSIGITASNLSVCPTTTVNLNAQGAASYTWQPGNVNGNANSVSPSVTAVYSVSGSSPGACNGNTTITIFVYPVPSLTLNAPVNVCAGDTVTLSASGAQAYTWQPGNISAAAFTIAPISSAIYTITGVNSSSCSSSQTLALQLNPLPILAIVSSHSVICPEETATLTASGAMQYVWNGNTTGNSYTIQPTVNTVYTVTGTGLNACVNTHTFEQQVSECTGLDQQALQGDVSIRVFPNPGKDLVFLNRAVKHEIRLVSVSGQVLRIYGPETSESRALDIRDIPAGLYFLEILDKMKTEKIKLIILP